MREDLRSLHVKYWLLCASRRYSLVGKEPEIFAQEDDLDVKSFALHLFVSKHQGDLDVMNFALHLFVSNE